MSSSSGAQAEWSLGMNDINPNDINRVAPWILDSLKLSKVQLLRKYSAMADIIPEAFEE
jgi:hypothetical protein